MEVSYYSDVQSKIICVSVSVRPNASHFFHSSIEILEGVQRSHVNNSASQIRNALACALNFCGILVIIFPCPSVVDFQHLVRVFNTIAPRPVYQSEIFH